MIHRISIEDLEAEIEIQVAAGWARWRYVYPPKIVFEPKYGPAFFLRPRSNNWEFLPKH